MHTFEISDRLTTADIGLEITGDSLGELFTAGAEGMFAIIFGGCPPARTPVEKAISLQAETAEQLLVDWLSELLYIFDTENRAAVDYHFDIDADGSGFGLQGQVTFGLFVRETDAAEHEIKAVTYYKLDIIKDGGVYRCHVVFDL